jgi:hypothetical protein
LMCESQAICYFSVLVSAFFASSSSYKRVKVNRSRADQNKYKSSISSLSLSCRYETKRNGINSHQKPLHFTSQAPYHSIHPFAFLLEPFGFLSLVQKQIKRQNHL